MKKQDKIETAVAGIGLNFRTFGGGQGSRTNPLADALKNQDLQFAAGVDVKEVVGYVLDLLEAMT